MPRKANIPCLLLTLAALAILIGAVAFLTVAQQAQIPAGHSADDGHNHG